MFNRGREERELAQVATQIEPYRNVVVAYEADQRLGAIDMDLLTKGRHVVTSNDRYQFSAAYLTLARNRSMLSDKVAESMTSPGQGNDDLKTAEFDYDTVTSFMLAGYQAATDGLEAADRIGAIKGYAATPQETGNLQAMLTGLGWPASTQISRRFVSGAIEGLRAIGVSTNARYLEMTKNTALQNNMKIRLKAHVDPLLASLEAKQKSIDLITHGLADAIKSEQVLKDVYKDVVSALEAADTVGLWLTAPKLLDASFTLAKPLDETRPEGKSFNPASLGGPAVRQTVPAPAPSPQPNVQGKSFDPSGLQPSTTPSRPAPKPAGKSFDPGSLAPQPPAQAPTVPPVQQAKTFDPNALKTPEKRSFDPSTLGRPAVEATSESEESEQQQPPRHKSFDPKDLL